MSESLAPMFLVGCPRSGTTLLQQMLDAHPDIAIAPETFFIRNFWLKRDIYSDLTIDHNYQKLLDDIVALPEFQEMELDADQYQSKAWETSRLYRNLFRLLLEQFAAQRAATWVGEKTPNHLLYMPTLQDFFPAAKFIHIVRDPRAVAKSWQTVPWTTGNLAGDTGVWHRYVSTARRSPEGLKNALFTLHYETLVTHPEPTLTELCQFLQIPFAPSMLTYHHRDSQIVNTQREPWKANAKRELSSASLNRWQSELSSSMITEIEVAAWPEMKHFGYHPVSNPVILATAKLAAILQGKLQRLIQRIKSQTLWELR